MDCAAHLSAEDAAKLLAAGSSLQQWLSVRVSNGFRFIRWMEVDAATGGGWNIYESDSLDLGPANRDMTSFPNDLDPDFPEGICYSCASVEAVFSKCTELGYSPAKFVRFCEIQLLYDAYILANGPPARSANEYFTTG